MILTAYLALALNTAGLTHPPIGPRMEEVQNEATQNERVTFGKLPNPTPEVLGTSILYGPPIPPSPTPTPIKTTKKSSITIALLGDSMIDTLGPDAPHFKSILEKTYPKTRFNIHNYGVGGLGIPAGIDRISNGYTYLERSFPPLVAKNPDIVVIESFGYNPFGDDQGALDQHWAYLSQAVDTIRAQLPNTRIVIAATIAPNAGWFGDGAPGIAFSTNDKWQRTNTIKKYLENAIRFAKSARLPLADAYHASLTTNGSGNLLYINSGDHIHYSDAGRALFGKILAGTIISNKLLE